MKHMVQSYLKFLWNSKNSHGVHSPFVFDLIRKCFYDKTSYTEYQVLEEYRNALLQNKNRIEVTDFGAGSRVFKSNIRAISRIAATAGISKKRAELLFRVVKYCKAESILEIGTSLGLATAALSLGSSGKVTTLEGCPNTMAIAETQCQLQNINNIEFVNTEFLAFFRTQNLQSTAYSLVYFDGNHSKKATLDYFESLLPTTTNQTVWIFDDIHWSQDMEDAWEIIKKHPKVTVTIDTFQWGFVFFRKEQEREHFIVRTSKSFFLDNVLGIKNLWGLLH